MIVIIQRVTKASVEVEDQVVGEISKGLLVLIAIEPNDTEAKAKRMAERVAGYRVFNDPEGKMNLNVKQAEGDILVVSQFTLAADTNSGMRPSFTTTAKPEISNLLYLHFTKQLRQKGFKAPTGKFGADMQVSLVNDGPVTFTLKV